ncbi:MAG: D-alanyl-D-alanine carboxypeptidase family protein [Oscillospiraceae bacterium]|nr:D-alanyl-D-alanine carboxypeptidase family protein [Oscillospiraceae bacterium]
MENKKKWKLLLILSAILLVLAIVGGVLYILQLPPKNDWYQKDGAVYFTDDNRDPVTGWFEQAGHRYYLDPANGGAMHTGWLELAEGTYYLDAEGHLLTAWQTLEGRTCYFLEDGRMALGWTVIEGQQYYFQDADGALQTGWLELDGQKYYLNDTGCMVTGWLELEGRKHYFDENGCMVSGWLDLEDQRYYFDENGCPVTGWLDLEGQRYYFDENGYMVTGWLELDDAKYYLNDDGALHTGWLEQDGQKYYLKEDGTVARGKLVIDEKTYYFTSTGANIIMVNSWNKVPDDYEVELTTLSNGKRVAVDCYDALMKMLSDCEAAGCHPNVIGAYRTVGDQRALMSNKIASLQEAGYSYSQAYARAMIQVAIPGHSEHHLGLALDILDRYYPESYSGENNCMVWLNEHCWEYGFIIRYPNEKTNITGIMFEPWHYRYVGVELAMEMRDSGLCLEEYLDQLTNDGTTCGNPNA